MDRVYKDIDGIPNVAVLYSPGYGAGWSTWNKEYKRQLLFDPAIVNMLEDNRPRYEIVSYVERTYGDDVYTGGVDQLTIRWIPEGTLFTIKEYDGSETIQLITDIDFEVT